MLACDMCAQKMNSALSQLATFGTPRNGRGFIGTDSALQMYLTIRLQRRRVGELEQDIGQGRVTARRCGEICQNETS